MAERGCLRRKLIGVAAGVLALAGCDGSPAPANAVADNAPAVAARPPAPAGAPARGSIEQQKKELLALERAYSDALIRGDRAFLEAYYAPDWRGGNWLGFWTKATMLKAVLEARYEVRSMTLQNVDVRIVGDVGIVQGVSNEVTRVDGRDTSGRWTFTDVFERRSGRWLAIGSHTSELTGQPAKD
jgi:hypothetical protein